MEVERESQSFSRINDQIRAFPARRTSFWNSYYPSATSWYGRPEGPRRDLKALIKLGRFQDPQRDATLTKDWNTVLGTDMFTFSPPHSCNFHSLSFCFHSSSSQVGLSIQFRIQPLFSCAPPQPQPRQMTGSGPTRLLSTRLSQFSVGWCRASRFSACRAPTESSRGSFIE